MKEQHVLQLPPSCSYKSLFLKALLLLSATTLIATSAWAFGGGGGGGRVSTRYKKGVDAIGIHVDPDNPIIPPDWRDCNEKTEVLVERTCCLKELVYANGTKCCDKTGYEVKNDKCVKQQPTCPDGYEWDGTKCAEVCPADRQCGETCCGEGNICVGGNQCCNQYFYENYYEDGGYWMCCPASESTGLGSYCCSLEQTTYTTDAYGTTRCCASSNLYKNAGYNNLSVCCDHEATDYTNHKAETFKVCWTNDTNCKTNADCAELGDNYSCNLKNETDWSCYYPTSGTCQQITTDDYEETDLDPEGEHWYVRRSKNNMTWWAADNWCKAQGKSLIDISKFGCYKSNTSTLVEEGSEYYDGCCASGQTCGWNSSWYTGVNKAKYSSTLKALESAFGHSGHLWTASDSSSTDSCGAFAMNLGGGTVDAGGRTDGFYALCE